MALCKLIWNKDLFLAEANDHVLLQNLAAAVVLLTVASPVPPCRPTIFKTMSMGRTAGTVGPLMQTAAATTTDFLWRMAWCTTAISDGGAETALFFGGEAGAVLTVAPLAGGRQADAHIEHSRALS